MFPAKLGRMMSMDQVTRARVAAGQFSAWGGERRAHHDTPSRLAVLIAAVVLAALIVAGTALAVSA